MAHLQQQQRYALEQIITDGQAATVEVDPSHALFLDPNTPLKILGVSEGYGTCAQVRGVNILLVGLDHEHNFASSVKHVGHVFLLREAKPEECGDYERRHRISVHVVEQLKKVSYDSHGIVLTSTGRKSMYVNRQM